MGQADLTKEQRNAAIFAGRMQKKSLRELGREFGVSQERIRSICFQYAARTGQTEFFEMNWRAISAAKRGKPIQDFQCPVCFKMVKRKAGSKNKTCSYRCGMKLREKYTETDYKMLAEMRAAGKRWKEIAHQYGDHKHISQVFSALKLKFGDRDANSNLPSEGRDTSSRRNNDHRTPEG